jgi:hypothetical protein
MELDERRANNICFWCDEKFIHVNNCKNKRLYSWCILEDKNETKEDGINEDEFIVETIIPHISINALEGIIWFHTIRVTRKVDKHLVFVMVDSKNTHNFINI